MDNIANEYFDWMCELVCDINDPLYSQHISLLNALHEREFTYILDMDYNRAMDGMDLRYRFAYEKNYDYRIVAKYLDIGPCSILEMMLAVAFHCENTMEDPELGNRLSYWFWEMVKSLGLYYSLSNIDEKLNRFLNREYFSNGEGGLFTIENCKYDLRTIEIWKQMCWYLNTFE